MELKNITGRTDRCRTDVRILLFFLIVLGVGDKALALNSQKHKPGSNWVEKLIAELIENRSRMDYPGTLKSILSTSECDEKESYQECLYYKVEKKFIRLRRAAVYARGTLSSMLLMEPLAHEQFSLMIMMHLSFGWLVLDRFFVHVCGLEFLLCVACFFGDESVDKIIEKQFDWILLGGMLVEVSRIYGVDSDSQWWRVDSNGYPEEKTASRKIKMPLEGVFMIELGQGNCIELDVLFFELGTKSIRVCKNSDGTGVISLLSKYALPSIQMNIWDLTPLMNFLRKQSIRDVEAVSY